MSQRDYSAQMPAELCADVLGYLPRSQMLAASAASRTWRRAGLLDTRFYLYFTNALDDPRFPPDSPLAAIQHAVRWNLKLSVSFQVSNWHPDPAQLLDGYSWEQFGEIIAPASHLVVRLVATLLVTDIGTGPLDLPYPALRELDLTLPRTYGVGITPVNVHILTHPPPSLRTIFLHDILPVKDHDSLESVTHLHLNSSHCSIATPEDPLPIGLIFPGLKHLSITPWRHYRSLYCEGIIGPTICWDGLQAQLVSLSLRDTDRTWRRFVSMQVLSHVPHIRLVVDYDRKNIGSELEALASVLVPPIDSAKDAEPEPEPEPEFQPLALLHLSHRNSQITVAQTRSSAPVQQQAVRSRVIITDPELWFECDVQLLERMLKPFVSHLVSLAVDWDPFIWRHPPDLPALRHLTLYINWDVNDYYEDGSGSDTEQDPAVASSDQNGRCFCAPDALLYPLLEHFTIIGVQKRRTLYRCATLHLLDLVSSWNRSGRLALKMYGVVIDGRVLTEETWRGLASVEILPEVVLDDSTFDVWTKLSEEWNLQIL